MSNLRCCGRAAVVNVLLDSGARANVLDKSFRRPIDVALEGFEDEEGSLAALQRQSNTNNSNNTNKNDMSVLFDWILTTTTTTTALLSNRVSDFRRFESMYSERKAKHDDD